MTDNAGTADRPMFCLPDPITQPDQIGGATFLYFNRTIALTIPAQVVEKDAFRLIGLVRRKEPRWTADFMTLVARWLVQQENGLNTQRALTPLQSRLIHVWLVYPANEAALERSAQLVEAAEVPLDELAKIADPINGACEMLRHILGEKYAEYDGDLDALYAYCAQLFADPIDDLVTRGYMLRLPLLSHAAKKGSPILLTNEGLLRFLGGLPVTPSRELPKDHTTDMVAFELFRQVLSPRIDPLDDERIEFVARLLRDRTAEVERLRTRCRDLALDVALADVSDIIATAERAVRQKMSRDIADVLEVDQAAMREFLTTLFSDKSTWIGVAGFIAGVVSGHATLTAGGAVTAMSTVGASALAAAAKRRERIRTSDYALVYRASRRR